MTCSRDPRRGGCSPCWTRRHRGAGRGSRCWTTSPRPSWRRRPPARCCLVLEDMHWADRSTQDFAAALSRTARGHLLLVLTFRSDELHRRHPFRKTLTEISRTLGSRRIDLGGLDRADIAGIVAAHIDGPPDPSVVGSVLARSEGNPLYAEELLAAEPAGDPGSPVRSPAGPDRRPRRGPAGAAPPGLDQRDPAGHRDARRAGGTRPDPDGGPSAGGSRRQRATPDRRATWSSGTPCCARPPTTT